MASAPGRARIALVVALLAAAGALVLDAGSLPSRAARAAAPAAASYPASTPPPKVGLASPRDVPSPESARRVEKAPRPAAALTVRIAGSAPMRGGVEVELWLDRAVVARASVRSDVARFDALPPGRYGVRVDPESLPRGVVAASGGERPLRISLERGEEREVSLAIESAASVAGRWLDVDGWPIEGAIVRARRPGEPFGGSRATTAGDGAFAFDGLAPGAWVVAAAGAATVELELSPGAGAWVELEEPAE